MRPILPILVALLVMTGCKSAHDVSRSEGPRGIYDFTTNRRAVCEVHGVTMSPQVVALQFGLTLPTDMVMARLDLFPHADEPYDTGFCVPLEESHGRVFVCTRCTEARAAWMRANTQKP